MISRNPTPSRAAGPDWFTRRIVLVTGKGGVGRTTVTAAMARAAAAAGRKVLVTAIGEPGGDYLPLARIYGRDVLPAEPEPLEPGVWGCLLWSRAGHRLFLERVLPTSVLVGAAMRSRSIRRLLDAAPSFHEMGLFYRLLTLIVLRGADGEPEFDLVLVDMPATGHSLALTGLPDILLQLMPTGPIADLLREGQSYLNDPALAAACVVTLPETLPVSESLELIDGLRTTRVPVGAVLVNRVPVDPFDADERTALQAAVNGHVLFGMHRFRSLDGTAAAIERLERHVRGPIREIPEIRMPGDDLVDRVAETLAAGAP